jgi:hypothetical protein
MVPSPAPSSRFLARRRGGVLTGLPSTATMMTVLVFIATSREGSVNETSSKILAFREMVGDFLR